MKTKKDIAYNNTQYHSSGGADENRTRVRKQVHPSFSECRLRLKFPKILLRNQSYIIGKSLNRGKGQDAP